MKKLFVTAVALATAMPMAAAQGPALLKGPVPAAPLKDWLGDTSVQGPASERTLVLSFALTVSRDGAVVGCTVEGSTGTPALDAAACDLLSKRGRFQAATDSAGKAVMGVYRGTMVWAPPGAAPTFQPIEMVVALQNMPGGLFDPSYVDLVVSTDETGRVDGCAIGQGYNWSGQAVPARVAAGKILGAVACSEALKGMKLDPAKNAEGNPVGSVQTARALFTAKPAELAGSNRKKAPTSAAADDPDAPILVQGQSVITRPEAAIAPAKGFARIVDYQAIGNELVLVQSADNQWYRMELEPYCIGNSRLTKISRFGAEVQVDSDMIERLPRELRDALFLQQGLTKVLPENMMIEEGLGFTTRADGSFDRYSEVVAKSIDGQDVVHIDSCRIRSLVESEPPKGWKQSSKPAKAVKPPAPILPAVRPANAPDGGPIYLVEWIEKPTPDQLAKMSGGRAASAWIMCQTAADNKVRNCRTASESPKLTGVANRMKLESGKFRVRPPMVDGRPAIGAWVAIGFDFTPSAKRQTALKCDPSNPLDPC